MHDDIQFQVNLSRMLAHSIVYEASADKVCELYNWDKGSDIPPAQSMGGIMQDLTKYLPDYSRAVAGQMAPLEQAQAAAATGVAPVYTKSNLDLYKAFGPELNKVGTDIARQNALAMAQNEADVMAGPGRSLVEQGKQLSEFADPEYYKGRQAVGNLMSQLDSGLTGSERAEAQRGLAQENLSRGVATNPSNLNALQNAMTFGSQVAQKRMNLANAIGNASAALTPLKSGVDPFQQATGRSGMNVGENKFIGVNTNAGQNAMQLGSGLLGSQSQLNSAAIGANAQLGAANTGAMSKMIPNIGCCFIFMEAYLGTLPWWVRKCRDAFYTEDMRKGYVRTSRILVPLMEKSKFFRDLVCHFMIAPLTSYGGYLHKVEGYENGHIYRKHTTFWFKLWTFIGKL